MNRLLIFPVAMLCFTTVVQADPTTRPVVDQKMIDDTLKLTGQLKDDVYTVTVPRTDLVLTLEGNDVPVGAGIESRFHFYTCPCGKTRVIGEFVLCEYESDDVVDSLREGFLMHVDSLAPMFTDERPRMRVVRFHGEGNAGELAEKIYGALQHVGDTRMQKNSKMNH